MISIQGSLIRTVNLEYIIPGQIKMCKWNPKLCIFVSVMDSYI